MGTKRTLIIIGIVLVTLGILNAVFYALTKKPKVVEVGVAPSPTPLVYQGVNPGSTATDTLKTVPDYVNQQKRGEFEVYQYKTNDPNINDEILVINGNVYMTKKVLIDTSGKFAPINGYFRTYGEPEALYFDKQFDIQMYAWPSKGFAVSGSRETDQAFRTYEFPQTTPAGFEDRFATEIRTFTASDGALGY